jgi:hypothetical protein
VRKCDSGWCSLFGMYALLEVLREVKININLLGTQPDKEGWVSVIRSVRG